MDGFLYVQSEYSFLKSMNKIQEYVKKAKEYGYKSINITDDSMHGAYKFYKECINNDIKPIIGLKVHLESKSRIETYILAYALNEKGYKSLLRISSRQAIKGMVTIDYLKELSNDLFFVTPGIEGEAEKNVLDGLIIEAKQVLKKYKEMLNNFYVGISLNNNLNDSSVASTMFDLATSLDINCLPVNRTLYLNKENKENYIYFRAIDDSKIEKIDGDYHLFNKEELDDLYYGFYELNENYNKLIERINVKIEKTKKTLPVFSSNKNVSSQELLHDLCVVGLKKRLNGNVSNKYVDRLIYELSVINKMGYEDYFLIVYDFIKYAKKNDILVGPGRGSAAGSLVSYCLGITNIDPLKFDLMFERFLNPERISMPDIDVDFPDNKRDQVIEYVKNKYGKMHVCHIATFQRFKSKMAIRDIARVLKLDSRIVDAVIDKIEDEDNINDFIKANSNLMENERISTLLTIASKVEGLPRQIGTHAAGIIISSDDLTENTAISNGIDDLYLSQYEASDLEELGLLKMDFLSLSNLSTIKNIIDNEKIDINKIPLNDKKTFELLSNADTSGIFQLESKGIRNVLLKLKPTKIDDIVATLSLYRPGPMDQINEFIERKNGKKFEYIHPSLEQILKPTYGIIVYQEQIIQISNVFAGYTLGEADVLRRAVSKKKHEALEGERKKFVTKSLMKGHSEKEANEIYDYIVKFANYGFNKSHAVAYSIVSYQMAYLKANYFKSFIVALMNDNISVASKISDYIRECKLRGIIVKEPDINISTDKFIINNGMVYYPLIGIKGFGINNCNKIIEERRNGLFNGLYDFKSRVDLSEQLTNSLIYSGCFDEFGTKKSLLKKSIDDSEIIIGSFDDPIEDKTSEIPLNELYKLEYEALGLNIKYHLFDNYRDVIKKEGLKSIKDIKDGVIDIICMVDKIKEITTRSNELMAFVTIADEECKIEVIMFPNCYKQLKNQIKYGIILKMRVAVEIKDGKKSLIVRDALVLGK